MAFLQIGTIPLEILTDASPAQPESDVGGETFRAFAGNLRSTRRWVKRKWTFVTKKITWTEEANLLSQIGSPDGGAFIACVGNFNNNVSVTCQVLITNRDYLKINATTIKRRLTLQLVEV